MINVKMMCHSKNKVSYNFLTYSEAKDPRGFSVASSLLGETLLGGSLCTHKKDKKTSINRAKEWSLLLLYVICVALVTCESEEALLACLGKIHATENVT